MILTYDVETTTKNKGNPFTASNKLISYSCKSNDEDVSFSYYTDIDFLARLKDLIPKASLIIGFNLKFDLSWASRYSIHPSDKVRIWDCQIAEFIISGQKEPYPSLNESLAKYGLGNKDDKIAEYWELGLDTTDIPVEELKFYNNLDVELTYKLYLKQQEVMTDKQKRLCLVMGLDLLVLQEMEENGVKFDRELCKLKADETKTALEKITNELLKYSPTPNINLDSGQQLSCLLYGGKFELVSVDRVETRVYKSGEKKGTEYEKTIYRTDVYSCPRLFTPLPDTTAKKPMKLSSGEEVIWYLTNEDVLKQLKTPTAVHKKIIKLLLDIAELTKLLDTYYGKLPDLLDKMEWGDFLHGQYNQCVAATGRLSSSAPNMQNFSGDVDKLLISRYE